jgi:asparagine synthase (glutamine-hydrolysing)
MRQMINAIRHRGPDGSGIHLDGGTGLAHARLSIIDHTDGGQPMSNGDGSLWITFNGEIFNYLELREDLIRKGHRFATASDTEVILRSYEEKGEDCVQDFNGQWAFAIWDARRRHLFISRDRMGILPLYYTTSDRAFLFASEIKSLFACPGVTREIDSAALHQTFTFWCTLPPRTIFKGVHELPAGHSLTLEDGVIRTRRYWQLKYPEPGDFADGDRSELQYAERLLELLTDATRIRLRADVPVGTYLSGGLDSSIITALARRLSGGPLKAFSITFDDLEFDERPYQDEVSRYLGIQRVERRCSDQDIGKVFPQVIWQAEKPILRTAPSPLFLLSRLVRDSGYKAVLTGEGSDEILGGYDIFKEAKIRSFWGAQPDSRVRPLLLKRLYPYLPNLQTQPTEYLNAFFKVTQGDLASKFFSHMPRWALTTRLQTFFSSDVKNAPQADSPLAAMENSLPEAYARWSPLCRAQYLETTLLMPGYILSSQGDRMSMAHSVEARFPFLDHRVVEFANSIPDQLKMRVLNEKYILKRCAERLIPLSVRTRTKQPYRAPEGRSFFGEGGGRDYVEALLEPGHIRKTGLFEAAAVQKLVEKFRRGQATGMKDNMALSGLLSTQLLAHQFIDNFEVTT